MAPGLLLGKGARKLAQGGINGLIQCSRFLQASISSAAQQQQQQWQYLKHAATCLPRNQQQQQQLCMLQLHRSKQRQPQQQCQLLPPLAARSITTSAAAAAEAAGDAASVEAQQQQQQWQPVTDSMHQLGTTQAELDRLLQVLLQPMPKGATWNAQLSPHLIKLNDQLLVEPSAALLSLVRALHVIKGVLQEDGHVYIVENNKLLRPLLKAAARSCINPNVWFHHHTWSPGTLTNYASHRRLFKEGHQPNRRLFAAKGLAMVNPLCPEPPAASAPLPRLSWADKWLLFSRSRRAGFKLLLEQVLAAEDTLHRIKPAGSLRGVPRDLRLMVFLDSTKNSVAIREAYNRNIPTVAIANTLRDMSQVTYPVLARDFHPNFVHFFLDWIVKVANVAPGKAPQLLKQLSGGE